MARLRGVILVVTVLAAFMIVGVCTYVIVDASKVPSYESTQDESKVLLLASQEQPVGTLEATIADGGRRISYFVNGVEDDVWLLLVGDARLTDIEFGKVIDDECKYPYVTEVDCQLVRPTASDAVTTDFVEIEGNPVVDPDRGASRWEFAAPTLDLSCDDGEISLLNDIDSDEFAADEVVAGCETLRADELAVCIVIDSDESLDSESDADRASSDDQQCFVTRDEQDEPGFQFAVTSAADAARTSMNAAVAGIILGVFLTLLVQLFYDSVLNPRRPTPPTPVARSQQPGSGKPVSLLGLVVIALLLLTGRKR